MNLVHNERVKLLATALNNTGIALAVTGAIAPVAASLYGTVPAGAPRLWFLIALAWLVGGGVLHISGQFVLGKLRE